jgi:D-glycero-D-manno-heptose 1,7-bisphosphate phosphatase
MKKVVFLDRDGVINKEVGDYVSNLDSFILNPGLESALSYWAQKGYSFAVITNQGGISKQRYTKEHVFKINAFLYQWFKERNLDLLTISFCPHHNSIESCICRKPNSLMLEKIIDKHSVLLNDSFLIGDSIRDIEAAEKVGLRGIKIVANSNLNTLISL